MAFKTERTDSEFPVFDLGWYTGVFIDAEAGEEGLYGPQVKLMFQVPHEDEDVSIWAWTSQKFSQRSKLFAYTEAILGRPIGDEEGFDSDKMQGMLVDLKLDTYEKDGVTKNKVIGMRKATGVAALHNPQALKAQAFVDSDQSEDIPF